MACIKFIVSQIGAKWLHIPKLHVGNNDTVPLTPAEECWLGNAEVLLWYVWKEYSVRLLSKKNPEPHFCCPPRSGRKSQPDTSMTDPSFHSSSVQTFESPGPIRCSEHGKSRNSQLELLTSAVTSSATSVFLSASSHLLKEPTGAEYLIASFGSLQFARDRNESIWSSTSFGASGSEKNSQYPKSS